MGSIHDWKPELYDQKLGFVSDYGKDVLRLLQPQPGEMILDLGCGTGDLSFEIQNSGARVLGMDYSPAMIEQGRRKYPSLDFIVGNAADFSWIKAWMPSSPTRPCTGSRMPRLSPLACGELFGREDGLLPNSAAGAT